ncbi:hypothetical protein FOL47_000441 [Perkinsus chesapeaki]|uniref:Uncharacterized protein n=1 Tax=Perkinsus chesapeaki TaxID=330153 RepID=A0A7J6MM40_PERCH|nr:hypothetical protein FOL47_000441 [Perkinsus chesapeaki]
MRRSYSTPSSDWKAGWHANALTLTSGPRFTVGRGAKHASNKEKPGYHLQNTKYTTGGGYRDTWVQVLTRQNKQPGPGRYRTPQEFNPGMNAQNRIGDSKDVVQTSRNILSSAPDFRFGTQEQETVLRKLRFGALKASYLNTHTGKSTDMKVTPGPGHYTQYTSFGAASGGSRRHYF